MANVFLLGNGFDLHHELPTKYENFLHTVHFLRDHYSETMNTVGSVFGNKYFKDCDKQIIKSYDLYKSAYDNAPLDSWVINELRNKAKENYWFNYLLSTFDEDRGWIDFEKEIALVLKAFENLFATKDAWGVNRDGEVFVYIYSLYNRVHEHILEQFDFFFYRETSRMAKKKYIIEKPFGSKNYGIDKERVIGDLYKFLEELSEMLKLYLTCFVDNVLEQLVLQNFISRNELFENANYVISFNYTDTYEKLYSNGKVAHIHGKNSENIVLGVNPDGADIIETVDTSFIQFKKYYQRVVDNTDFHYLRILSEIEKEKELYGNKLTLYVVGHSLDVTDEDIIKELFYKVKEIRVFYYDDKDIGSKVKNLVSIFGKKEFDKLRYDKKLTFLPL